MQEIRNNYFGSKMCSTTLRQAKTGKHECRNITATYLLYFKTRNITGTVIYPKYNNVAVIFRHSCLPVFAWRLVVHIFDPQLLRVSYILWCYHSKSYSIILENTCLWCFIVISSLFCFYLKSADSKIYVVQY